MKLKREYVTYNSKKDETIAVATGRESNNFKGMLRANEAGGFIIQCLKEDVTRDDILEKLKEEYDAPADVLARDLDDVLDTLKNIGALED